MATASFCRSVAFTAATASLIGRPDDASRWTTLATKIRTGFVEHYVHADGTILSDCATVYALAICFGLLDDAQRTAAGDRLAEIVAERDYRVTTGFAGTPFVTWALSETGHVDAAYRLPAPGRQSVLALSDHHGRHDDLGALGLDAAGRVDQSR